MGNKDLLSAVAVSGPAPMYLAPVIFCSLWGGRTDIPQWNYLRSFVLAVTGDVLYLTESSVYSTLLGDYHKYSKPLVISATLLIGGSMLFWLGDKTDTRSIRIPPNPA